MNRIQQTAELITAMVIVALLANGCASEHEGLTSTLWEKKWYHPAAKANLQLSYAPERKDILVRYDEQYEDPGKPRRRAYWLWGTGDRSEAAKPAFVDPEARPGLIPIPVLDPASVTNAPANGHYAVMTSAPGFELWQDGVSLGRFDLPDYYAAPKGIAWRVAVTPFAALVDGTVVIVVVAVVAGLIAGYFWLEAGAPTVWR